MALHPTRTTVRATLTLKPNAQTAAAPLVLDGDGLSLVSLKIDGAVLTPENYIATPDQLTIPQVPNQRFTLEIETLVDPTANLQLSGLYRSSGTYCTQCEAEGFRRITYFPDRPDVMAVYTTRIEAERKDVPVWHPDVRVWEVKDSAGRHKALFYGDYFARPSKRSGAWMTSLRDQQKLDG
ncbi:MAG: M3 family metallopeptidase, partial [Deltaproteobacteria bacterium]